MTSVEEEYEIIFVCVVVGFNVVVDVVVGENKSSTTTPEQVPHKHPPQPQTKQKDPRRDAHHRSLPESPTCCRAFETCGTSTIAAVGDW